MVGADDPSYNKVRPPLPRPGSPGLGRTARLRPPRQPVPAANRAIGRLARWLPAPLTLLVLIAAAPGDEAWYPGSDLQLEAHGFASFGYLDTWGDNWLGPTRGGTTQFWEVATNVVARPLDRLRIGAQLYARDLVDYDNGRVMLDWAYADYRLTDEIGVQVGRVKIPLGLYNENIDVDVARASVFMPVQFYSLVDRDLYISIDGAKIYGHVEMGTLGSGDYALYAGRKPLRTDGAFATNYAASEGLGDQVNAISTSWAAGGMVQWNPPLSGLAARLSLGDLHEFDVQASSSTTGLSTDTSVTNYYEAILSLQYDIHAMTFAAEYERLRGRGQTTVQPIDLTQPLLDSGERAYISATWHMRRWLEWYAAFEQSWADIHQPSGLHSYAWVGAVNVLPLANWSIKAEFREEEGTEGLLASDNPQGLSKHWQVLALKTTVDF